MTRTYTTHPHADQMIEATRTAIQDLRRSLIELYSEIGLDPNTPQAVARKLGLNRNLTWKLSRVVSAADPFAALNHLPGQQGLDLAINAFRQAGAPDTAVDHVTRAYERFHVLVAMHAEDREQFELTLESMGILEREGGAETGREMAFRGNSMIWGVQAKTRVCLALIGPSATAGATDIVQVGGMVGFRRLRPTARWRLFRLQMHDDKGTGMPQMQIPEEIEARKEGETPLMLREFCSPNMPQLETVLSPDACEYFLPGGQIGKESMFDCFFAYIARGLPAFRSPDNLFGSLAISNTMPTEQLVFDVLVHRSIELGGKLEVNLYGFPHGGIDTPAAQSVQNELPITAEAVELAGMPPAIATSLVPRYNQIAARIYTRMGWNPSEFRGYRVRLSYPPMSSKMVVRWNLPEKPA